MTIFQQMHKLRTYIHQNFKYLTEADKAEFITNYIFYSIALETIEYVFTIDQIRNNFCVCNLYLIIDIQDIQQFLIISFAIPMTSIYRENTFIAYVDFVKIRIKKI